MKTITSLCLLLFASNFCHAKATQSPQSIQDAIQGFVESSLLPDGQYQIGSAQIDNRLQLPACERSLEVFAQSKEIKPGRNTVGVRCAGANPWTIYSTVTIKSFKDVLVLTKQLNKNDRISAEHLTTESRDIGTLQQGYIVDPEDIVGKQATRPVAPGTALNRTHYAEPTLIKRGDQVNIQSGRVGLLISSKGVAMMNGIKGQRITVKNSSSQRVIQATVENPGVVTVHF